ncbi:MAG: 3-dehydroquinate synthase, partial [Chlamydiae bacterium]|nr:3-dehydroquinate synthase [Chlamydiota bacterium]
MRSKALSSEDVAIVANNMKVLNATFITPPKSTKVYLGNQIDLPSQISALEKRSKLAFIADKKVYHLHREKITLKNRSIPLFQFPAKEKNKTRKLKEEIENWLFAQKMDRQSCLVAIGGGTTLDVAGFVAATYCRGISLIFIPTTLLAMVDSCLGGKTAVNMPFAKNYLGTFYPAEEIWIDLQFLSTLPKNEQLNGMAEMIKYGLIRSEKLFNRLLSKPALLEKNNDFSANLKAAFEQQCVEHMGEKADFRDAKK